MTDKDKITLCISVGIFGVMVTTLILMANIANTVNPTETITTTQTTVVPVKINFPILDATYQLDRARFDKVVICTTENLMEEYIEAERTNDYAKMVKMVVEPQERLDNLVEEAESEGCILISVLSQAKIIKKGVSVHRAEFSAWPIEPMWGNYLTFGGQKR